MSQLLLDPVIISFCLVLFTIALTILLRLGDRKKASNIIERIFIVTFIVITPGLSIIPFSYLNPASLPPPSTRLDGPTFLSQLCFYSLIAFLLRSRFTSFFSSLGSLLRNPFLIALLLLTVLSALWSETPTLTFIASLILVGYSFLASYIASRYNFQEIGGFLRQAGTFNTVAGALAALLVPSIGRMSGVGEAGEWQGLQTHKNGFGLWMALTSALWFLHAVKHPKSRWLSIGFATLSLFVMLPAQSGSSKLLFFLMIGVLLVSNLAQSLRQLSFRTSFVVSIFITILSGLSSVILLANGPLVLALLGKDASLTGRTDFWPQLMQAVWRKPLLGYGYQGFWQPWRGYENPARSIIVGSTQFVPPHAHNGYLDILLATGFVGMTLFVLALITVLVNFLLCVRHSRNGEAEIAAILLIFVLLSSLSESKLWFINEFTFLFFILSVRLNIDASKKSVKPMHILKHSIQLRDHV